jgi:hypothetical protein
VLFVARASPVSSIAGSVAFKKEVVGSQRTEERHTILDKTFSLKVKDVGSGCMQK